MKVKIFSILLLCTYLTINMMAETTQLDEVTVVSASGFEQNIAQAPASISVVTAEELQKKSYSDVLDAVKNIPGVFVSGSGGSEQEIKIRGMEEEYTLYLVDGKPISTSRSIHSDNKKTQGKIGLHLPNIDMIERIEVVRGPMSSLYGSEAMGGVINIITKKVSNSWNGSISTEYTKSKNSINNDNKNASFYLNGPLIKDRLSLSLNALKQKTFESDISDEHGQKEADKTKLGGKLTWKINEKNSATFEYEHGKQEYESKLDDLEYGQRKAIYSLTHELNQKEYKVNTYLQKDKTESIEGEKQKEEILTFNTQASYFFENNTMTFGGQYKKEEFSDGINEFASEVDRWLSAIFLENDWFITDRFSLTLGLRYNYDEFFKGELTPRVYGVYELNDNFTFKGGISTGYKQPGLTEASDDYGFVVNRRGTPIGVEVGNSDLEPEKSTNYEIGFNYSLPQNGITSSLMIFHTDYKNKLINEYTCGDQRNTAGGCFYNGTEYRFIRQKVNVDKAQIQGLEFTIDYKIVPNVTITANYSYTKSEQKSGDYKGEALNKLPKHMYNINFDWEVNSKFDVWTQYNYRGKTSDYLSGTSMIKGTPSYGFIDLGVVHKVRKNLTLKAGVYNVLNKITEYDEYGTVLDGRRINIGLNYKF